LLAAPVFGRILAKDLGDAGLEREPADVPHGRDVVWDLAAALRLP
jgi:hypothetical protein